MDFENCVLLFNFIDKIHKGFITFVVNKVSCCHNVHKNTELNLRKAASIKFHE